MTLRKQTYLKDLTPEQFDWEFAGRMLAAKLIDIAIIDVTNDRGPITAPVLFAQRVERVEILMSIKWHTLNPDNRIIHPAGHTTVQEGGF